MIVVKQSPRYTPDAVRSRYVRFDALSGEFRFCEVGDDRRYDLRQGIVREDEIPPDVAHAARERAGFFPSYVDWPMECDR